MFAYHPTPIQEIDHPLMRSAGVRLLVKREDLNHSAISGNKWWKLKLNVAEARRSGNDTLLTFGGAYSNHIYATAAAAYAEGFKSIGIIRGDNTLPLNATLQFAANHGMQLHYISREQYREKSNAAFIEGLHSQFGNFYSIPEGGTNAFAVAGCALFGETLSSLAYDYLCVPVGTGGTVAGLLTALPSTKKVLGFSVLKGGEFLTDDVAALTAHADVQPEWRIVTEYHFGGYAKHSKVLLDFIGDLDKDYALPLDHVYTGKMFYGIFDMVAQGHIPRGTTILAIHTGGLQGRLTATS